VPFSCKGRGWCPSCGGRRMTERAAHLVDAVLPRVPVRQWVLTVPYRLRYRLAWNHGLSRAVLRVYTRVLLDLYARGARARGVPGGRAGSVTVMQRAGSGLNANPGRGRAGVSSRAGAERRRGGGSAGHGAPPGAAAAGPPRPGAGRRRDGAGGSARGRVPRTGGDRRGLGPGAGGAGLSRGCAGAATWLRARHAARDVARAAAGAPRFPLEHPEIDQPIVLRSPPAPHRERGLHAATIATACRSVNVSQRIRTLYPGSDSSSFRAAARSGVCNPSVNQSRTGASRRRASSTWPCRCHSRLKLTEILSSQDLATC
jgi:Transposase zinc-binding domain